MTAAIPPITGIVTPPTPPAPLTPTTGTTPSSGASFGQLLGQGLGDVEQAQSTSDSLAVQAATGSLTDVQDYLAASTEAGLATQLTVAVTNKAVDAFNEIMRLQA